MNTSDLKDFDIFFYYDQGNVDLEIASDVMAGLIQPKGTLLYNRQDGSGISSYENLPTGLLLSIKF